MNKHRVVIVGNDASKKMQLQGFIDKIVSFPERNIMVNFKEWLGQLPSECYEISDDGSIELNSDKFGFAVRSTLWLATTLSDAFKVWSPVIFLKHYSGCDGDRKATELLHSRNGVIVGTIQYRTKSRDLPQYIIHLGNGEIHHAKDYAEAFKIISSH